MKNQGQVNSLAVSAKQGSAEAMWELKWRFLNFIHRLSDSCRNNIPSQSAFEEECFKLVEEAVSRFDPNLGNFSQLLVPSIKRRLGRHRARFKDGDKHMKADPLPDISDGEEDRKYFDIKDDLAIVDEKFLVNEKVTGLAAGDPRKLAILNSWLDPYFNDSSTAILLAQNCGGKAESHRKFIQRFRTECQKALANAV